MAVKKQFKGTVKAKVATPVKTKKEEVKVVEEPIVEDENLEVVENEEEAEVVEEVKETKTKKKPAKTTKKKKEEVVEEEQDEEEIIEEDEETEVSEEDEEEVKETKTTKLSRNPFDRSKNDKVITESDSYTRKDLYRDVMNDLNEYYEGKLLLADAERIVNSVEKILMRATDQHSVRFLGTTIRRTLRNKLVSKPPKADFHTYKEQRYVKTLSSDIGEPALFGGKISDDDTKFYIDRKWDYTVDNGPNKKPGGYVEASGVIDLTKDELTFIKSKK